jgi:hypothetical protein
MWIAKTLVLFIKLYTLKYKSPVLVGRKSNPNPIYLVSVFIDYMFLPQ